MFQHVHLSFSQEKETWIKDKYVEKKFVRKASSPDLGKSAKRFYDLIIMDQVRLA